MRRLFGTDGIRDIANVGLTAERAMKIGRALASLLSSREKYKPTVFIGYDTRISSEMLFAALSAGLLSGGSDVVELGVISTPAVAYLTKKHGARAGIMISASHNPYEYNGIKIFSGDGFKLSDELEEEIESMVLDDTPPIRSAPPDALGKLISGKALSEEYTDFLASTCDSDFGKLKIALDTANGAASTTAEKLFRRLGATPLVLFDKPDGVNVNAACGSTNLTALKEYVVRNGMDVGFAFDGDADRCLAVDETGAEIDGDFIMAILADEMKRRGKLQKNTVVGTVMTNLGFVKFCEKSGIGFHATKVGDRYVLEAMNNEGFNLGGEQSGHIIIRDYATTGDGQLTAITLLSYIVKSGKKLSELASVMKKYPQYTFNVEATREDKVSFFTDGEIKRIMEEASARLGESGRILARPSGTEPYIRIMAEGENAELTASCAKETAELIKERLVSFRA